MKALKCILSRFVAIEEYNYSTICEDLRALILSIDRGCYFQEGGKINMTMDVETAFQKSIVTLVNWIGREVNMSKTKIFFRTYSPVHFRGGDWKTGGSCHLETLPDLLSPQESLRYSFEYMTVIHVLSQLSNKSKG
ncbi:protein trichome birefringence-like 10 [Solanum tuberosum]|uniref:protein trichome birefringence-like 10 n=1 Tax=Solanum tuberosum TaxID=4113 RepID=UPI00073A12A8|nr:PREDICTED: protein trichome birefringence-like 10 [Solanum tuberosum]